MFIPCLSQVQTFGVTGLVRVQKKALTSFRQLLEKAVNTVILIFIQCFERST